MEEEKGNQEALIVPETLELEEADRADSMFLTGVKLPGYVDTSDAKVLGAVKQVFKDFSYDAANDAAKQFRDVDALADYVMASIDEMNEAKQMGDRASVARNGAILARFWYMAERLDSALASGKYGQGVGGQLAAKMGLALSTIYSIRAVAKALTPSECWLMGTRGCKQTHLRKLAAIPDADLRKSILEAFLSAVDNTADPDAMEKARKQLTTACNRGDHGDFAEISTSNLEAGQLAPGEYEKGLAAVKILEKLVKPLADNDKFVDIRDALGNVFVASDEPDAQTRVDVIVGQAAEVKLLLETAEVNLRNLGVELDSLIAGLAVTDENGDPVPR